MSKAVKKMASLIYRRGQNPEVNRWMAAVESTNISNMGHIVACG
jgi:hypothetical protein